MMGDRRAIYKVMGGGVTCALVILSVRTGSRMGLIMLAVVFGMFWIRASAAKKIGLLVATAMLAVVAVMLSSPGTIARYRTMFSNNDDVDMSVNTEASDAVGSSMARRALMEEAWDYSLHHPIVGVGPGQFLNATGGNAEARAEHLAWHETHNTYLQLSSEAGFPAAILYIALIVYSTRTTFRIYRQYKREPENAEIANIAYVLLVSNFGFIVGAMFGSMAYLFPYPVIVAIVVGFERSVAQRAAGPHDEGRARTSLPAHLAPQYT
jgi:O-antigen ligase